MRKLRAALSLLALFAVFVVPIGTSIAAPQAELSAPKVYEPQIPTSPPLVMMHETTGELWRVTYRAADGRIDRIEIGYQDGRQGVFKFDDKGRLNTFSNSNEGVLNYEARYDSSGLIATARRFSADGKVVSLFNRLPDGSVETLDYDAQGIVLRSVVTAADGSQKISQRANSSAPVQITQSQAVITTRTLSGPGNSRYEVTLNGVHVTAWKYYNAAGTLQNEGKKLPDGTVEITVNRSGGYPSFKQIWKVQGEDWGRKYYRLDSIQEYDWQGNPNTLTVVNANGRTPKMTVSSWSGRKSYAAFYDDEGRQIRTEYYDSTGAITSVYHSTPGYYKTEISAALREVPTDGKAPAYRLQGMPFSQPAPAAGFEIDSLFIVP